MSQFVEAPLAHRLGRPALLLSLTCLIASCSASAVPSAPLSSGASTGPPVGTILPSAPPGGGTASFTDTSRVTLSDASECGGTFEETSLTTMVVTFAADGAATATVEEQIDEVEVWAEGQCGYGAHTTTTSSHVSGTRDTRASWSVSDDGLLEFSSVWDYVGGGTRTENGRVTTTEVFFPYDNLSFTAQVDPNQTVISGSRTEDLSRDDTTDVKTEFIVYAWTINR